MSDGGSGDRACEAYDRCRKVSDIPSITTTEGMGCKSLLETRIVENTFEEVVDMAPVSWAIEIELRAA